MRSFILILGLVLLLAGPALADPRDERIRRLQAEKEDLEVKLARAESRLVDLERVLHEREADLRDRLADLELRSRQVRRDLETRLEEMQEDRERAERALQEEMNDLQRRFSMDRDEFEQAYSKQRMEFDELRHELERKSAAYEQEAEQARYLNKELSDEVEQLRFVVGACKPLVLAALRSEDEELRREAVRAALAAGIEEAGPILVRRLSAQDPKLRLEAAEGLLFLGRKTEALGALQEWVVDAKLPDAHRDDALLLLLRGADPRALASLAPVARARGAWGVTRLGRALAEHDDAAGIPICLDALSQAKEAEQKKPLGETLAFLFGEGRPAGVEYAALWKATRAGSLADVRRSAAVLSTLWSFRITFEFENTPLENIVEFLSQVTDVDWVCLPLSKSVTVTARCEDTVVDEAARRALSGTGLVHRVVRGRVFVGPPEEIEEAAKPRSTGLTVPSRRPQEPKWLEVMRRALKCPVSAEFDEAAVSDALRFLSVTREINILRIDEADWEARPVSLRVDEVPVSTFVSLICEAGGLHAEVRWQAIVVGPADRVAALGGDAIVEASAGGTKEQQEILDGVVESIDFEETSLAAALGHLSSVAELMIITDNEVDPLDLEVTADLEGMTLRNALRCILRPLGLTHRFDGGVLKVVPVE